MSVSIIKHYFPNLSDLQFEQMSTLKDLYSVWNSQINLISRNDLEHLYQRHVLHSLAIAKVIKFPKGATVLDIGTGGGFPGIPLAILFPQTTFHLIDGTAKKIKVVNNVIEELKLGNATAKQIRAEEIKKKYDFALSRAVCDFTKLRLLAKPLLRKKGLLITLKGGDLSKEVQTSQRCSIFKISDFYAEDFFENKYVITDEK